MSELETLRINREQHWCEDCGEVHGAVHVDAQIGALQDILGRPTAWCSCGHGGGWHEAGPCGYHIPKEDGTAERECVCSGMVAG